MGPHDRLKGTVKWFDSRRGFGFITPESHHGDVFVHQSSIEAVGFRSLTAGEAVEFLLSVGGNGHSSAVSVTGPGGVCIQGRRCFDHAWFSCNEAAYMTGNCKSNPSFGGIDPCYNRKEAGHIDSQCTIIPSTKVLKPWKVDLGISSGLRANAFHSELKERSDEKSESEIQRGEGWRNWAELPDDLLMVIFKKFTAAEVLRSVQFVCRPWRQLSFVPALWRYVDMRMDDINHDLESLAMMAVARSAGCIEELYMEEFPTEKLMRYIQRRAPLLRRLHLIYACLEVYSLVEAIRNFQLLEELVILRSSSSIQEIHQVAQACPQLKSFALNEKSYKRADSDADIDLEVDPDTEALAIAKHMKQLRRLQLIGNGLTSRGLLAILNNCLHLECLDIRRCFYIDFDEYLKNKCMRIKTLRVPNDSLADYDYTISESDCNDATDFEPTLSDTEFWSPYDECFEMDYYDETY